MFFPDRVSKLRAPCTKCTVLNLEKITENKADSSACGLSTVLQASLLVATYYCTENKLAERFASLKQPGQIQKGITANQNSLLSQLILKEISLKRQQVTRLNHKTVTRHKRNHKTTSHDQVKTRVPKNYLMVLKAFKISQSANNYLSNNQLEHLKKMGISKSHDDLLV